MLEILNDLWRQTQRNQFEAAKDKKSAVSSVSKEQIQTAKGENHREIYAIVTDLTEDFIVARADGEDYYVLRSDTEFDFMVEDEVRLVEAQSENENGDTDKTIVSIEPAKIVIESGRVTSVDENLIIFDDRAIFFGRFELQQNQLCEYEAIVSKQTNFGKTFRWRVTGIRDIKKLEDVELLVEMPGLKFSVAKHKSNIVENFITITNRSSMKLSVTNAWFEIPSEMIELKKLRKNVQLQRRGQEFKIFFSFLPRQTGQQKFKLVVDIEITGEQRTFQKFCEIDVIVYPEKIVYISEPKVETPRFKEISMQVQRVPDKLRRINVSNVAAGIEKLRSMQPACFDELSQQNYLQKVHTGLWIEEMSIELAFQNYRIENGRFSVHDDLLMKLQVEDVAEKRPSIIIGDRVEARKLTAVGGPNSLNVISVGRIRKVGEDFVLVKFSEKVPRDFTTHEYLIDFKFSSSVFRQQHHAINTVTSNFGLGYNVLFPENAKIEPRFNQIDVDLKDGKLMRYGKELKWFDAKLNNYQKEAIRNVLQGECRPLPYIIYGPPGTGKTMTIVELIKQLFHIDNNFRIIVAAPSNSAAYSLTETLTQPSSVHPGISSRDLIRIVSNLQLETGSIPDYLKEFCVTVTTGENALAPETTERTHIRKNLRKQDIINFRICIGTLSSLGPLMQMKFKKNHFTHVIIDEAGQATEASTLIPLTLLSRQSGQIVLAGDPKQLGSRVSMIGKVLQADISLIERLLNDNACYSQSHGPESNEYDPRFVTKLRINYRSVPSVLRLYNELFYNSELQGAIPGEGGYDAMLLKTVEVNLKRERNCGVHFFNVVKGFNQREKDSCSWFNKGEVNSIFAFLLVMNQRLNIPFKDIGVITPYALQKVKLKAAIDKIPDTDLKIGTVEEFQGQERQYILVSLVRTDVSYFDSDNKFGLGFLNCPKRMNVAISRARSLLVIFGNAALLRHDQRWNQLIEYTIQNGTFTEDSRS